MRKKFLGCALATALQTTLQSLQDQINQIVSQ